MERVWGSEGKNAPEPNGNPGLVPGVNSSTTEMMCCCAVDAGASPA
jgi:hypothetical protein